MKTKLTLALVALITSSAFAAIPAVLPEFKNAEQLAEWRDEMAAKHAATTTATCDHAFYTGKPYIESTGSYAFKYRSYNPELARWTSEDPSGFPDGANGHSYAPTPTNGIDFSGLFAVLLNNFGASKDTWTDSNTLKTYTVSTYNMEVLSASDFNFSYTGWTFTAGMLNDTMNIQEYTPYALDGYGSCNFLATISGPLLSSENWNWVQIITCNTPGNAGKTGTFFDSNDLDPFYRGQKGRDFIVDQPSRPYSQLGTLTGGAPISWEAQTYFVKYSETNVTVFGGVKWKFTISVE
jgi:RHS repeat-associated protein